MITVKINVSRIDKKWFFKGKNGTYMDLVLLENDKPDQYGNDYMVVQGIPKEERDKGVRGEILGNGKTFGSKPKQQSQPVSRPTVESDTNGSVPF